MHNGVRNKIVYKINIMVLTCFSVRNIFLALIFLIITLFLCLNIFITFRWNTTWIKHSSSRSLFSSGKTKSASKSVFEKVLNITQCYDRDLQTRIEQRGEFWVFYNYIKAEKRHRCFESITYTTQGDYTFLDNVIPLVESWRGPISIAIHAPGEDFQPTVDSIAYLRNCETPLIKQYVTFHIFFDGEHLPKLIVPQALTSLYEDFYNCSKPAPYVNRTYKDLYKTKVNISYPINVARNIARISAQTHFVLASDIELYPTRNTISRFLNMVMHKKELFQTNIPKVFVLPVFEILANETVPENKTVLQQMVHSKKAFFFHKRICSPCHSIPNATEWINLPEVKDLDVFTTVKRRGQYSRWEAFYIGTNKDPLFDERLPWEGQSNKMIQAYLLCVLNYDYVILDNAFLVHKPGVKKAKLQLYKYGWQVKRSNRLISETIKPELRALYGVHKGCV